MSTTPDYWTYHAHGDSCFVIADRLGNSLIGDQLPSTETEARLLCRVANVARKEALLMERARVRTLMVEGERMNPA